MPRDAALGIVGNEAAQRQIGRVVAALGIG